MASLSRARPDGAGSGRSNSSTRASISLATRSSSRGKVMVRERRGERTALLPAVHPNTTLLLTATGGYNARAMAIQAVMGVRTKVKHRHPWLRRAASVVLLVFAGLLLSIILFRFVNP